jgi:oxalate decarboxylase/phosphoglucose isomerase-like protein (cupin superfamily)
MLVQKVVLQPGKWEGIHPHPGNQLYIMLTDGQSTIRYGDEETTSASRAGSVGWQRAVDLSEEHKSGNTGDSPIEFLWVNLKQ